MSQEDLERAVALAERLLAESASDRSQQRFARLVADEAGKKLAIGFADQVLRIREPRRATARFRARSRRTACPAFAGPLDRSMLAVGSARSRLVPGLVMPLVRRAHPARDERRHPLGATIPAFARHVARRRARRLRLNVNLLGEAILGDDEAARRLRGRDRLRRARRRRLRVGEDLGALRPPRRARVRRRRSTRIAERAARALPRHGRPSARSSTSTWRSTATSTSPSRRSRACSTSRSSPRSTPASSCRPTSPTRTAALERAGDWAAARHDRAGGDASRCASSRAPTSRWSRSRPSCTAGRRRRTRPRPTSTPTTSACSTGARPSTRAGAVRVGVASHNLFDVAWALASRRRTARRPRRHRDARGHGPAAGAAPCAPTAGGSAALRAGRAARRASTPRSPTSSAGSTRTPAPENFLRRLFTRGPASPASSGGRRFVAARRATRHTRRRRAAPDAGPPAPSARVAAPAAPFANEPDTDFDAAANRAWLAEAMAPGAGRDVAPRGRRRRRRRRGRTPPAAGVVGAADRRRIVRAAVAEAIARRAGPPLAVMAHETGKTVAEGDPEVSEADRLRPLVRRRPHAIDELRRRPRASRRTGVVVVASPWNFPLAIPAGGVSRRSPPAVP